MALTKTDIINLAFSKLGSERLTLTDAEITANELSHAKTANLHYTYTLHELVRMHKWNCCKARVKLTNSTTSSAPLFEYKEQHNLPSDYIRSTYVTDTDSVYEYGKSRIDYSVEGDKILSNHKELWMCYVKEPAPSAMDSLFAQAFVVLLAGRMAIPITGDFAQYKLLLQEFDTVIMPEARRINAFEKQDLPTVDSAWLESTYTSGSSYSNSYPPFSQSSYGSFS